MRTSDVPRGTSLHLGRLLAVLIAAVVAVLAWGEVVHAGAAVRHRRALRADPVGNGIVLVLGFRNRALRINSINRWRVAIALRTARRIDAGNAKVVILCSGGAVGGAVAEAHLLAQELRRRRWAGDIVIEDQSRTTWENIRNSIPHLGRADWISVASNGLHAEKARRYLAKQRPDLAQRLVPARDYRPGERMIVKPLFAAVGLWKLRAAQRS